MKRKRTLVLSGLLGLNAWAGACDVAPPPPDPDFARWEGLLRESRRQASATAPNTLDTVSEGVRHINMDEATLRKPPSLQPEAVGHFQPCPTEIVSRYQSSELPTLACETVPLPFVEVRAMAAKALSLIHI